MNKLRSYSWRNVKGDLGKKIEELLLNNGWIRKENRSPVELLRMKLDDFTCIFYKNGTLYISYPDYKEKNFRELRDLINSYVGVRYIVPSKDFLIGFDEVGKGEVIGSIILAGVRFSRELFDDLDIIVDNVDTKHNHRMEYWEEIYRKLEESKDRGFCFLIEKISPREINGKENVNKLLDQRYKKLLEDLIEGLDISRFRIVIDDYGVGSILAEYLTKLKKQGAEIVVVDKSEDKYLETRIASIIAKYERYVELENIGIPFGSGSVGDKKTIDWLREWYRVHREWPWFVKKSFKTIKRIESYIDNKGR
ncbi:MAG: hypothetical protein N2380_04895 [bacterium]|nr:hypothetical protein [bacterium]